MFKNTSLLKYSKKYSHFSYITINLISCIIFKFMSTWSGTTMSTSWRRQWHPTPVLLPGKSHGWRSLVGCSPWGHSESDMTEQLHFHFSLSCTGEGNGNPLQCSCLENPRDGEPGGLSSLESHRVGHDWSDLAACLRLYGSGESLLLRSIFQQLTILVDVFINYKLLVTLFWLIYYLIVTLQIWGLCWWLSW